MVKVSGNFPEKYPPTVLPTPKIMRDMPVLNFYYSGEEYSGSILLRVVEVNPSINPSKAKSKIIGFIEE
jgi:hypothetical protein